MDSPFPDMDHLSEYSVSWEIATDNELGELEHAVTTATREEDIQQHIAKNPRCLVFHPGIAATGQRWVLPKVRLGPHGTDFLLACHDSTGIRWVAVELERHDRVMFTKNGDPSAVLTHGLRQIDDWRSWLQANLDCAQRPRSRHGLGLTGIAPDLDGLLIMSRRSQESPDTFERRRRLAVRERVSIHTYDFLFDCLRHTRVTAAMLPESDT